MRRLFTAPDAWSGGDFDLLLLLGNVSEATTRDLLDRLWSHRTLQGCWLDRDVEPEDQSRVAAGDSKHELVAFLHGGATLPNGTQCNCRSVVGNDDDGTWLNLGIPLGGLAQSYSVGAYPFDDGSDLAWVVFVSEWLVDIARSVFARCPFEWGLVGFEVTDELGVRKSDIPGERWIGYLRNESGRLAWYPPNMLRAPFSIG